MSSFGSQMRKRFAELRKAGENVPRIINEVAEGATIEAVNKATKLTPPNNGGLAGTNARSGQMARHWQIDSQTTPVMKGTVNSISATTILANDMLYASYVSDGHRMDKHFVPGLHDVGGKLNYDAGFDGGIMVGTKTSYVPGIHMKEAAIGAYRSTVRKELDKRVKEAFK